ncbi:uncharacterized protein PV06_10688 [Exophiala oligosperma]|uniref:Tautomerase cis-CaaD-like domain-containing protein n=2 Tax=Chaetothyriales TaxID=34395 RepID=A0A0D2DMV8_9EURO|nr:uncharacterized protein PV06_10688 [Exophiala oligosperma]KAJ9640164.1 hypothetical protein H2204_003389 [Knufia peltigerae]KIW37059.1 hypothetical protein PV06_10688 [Exophiala oligosperma]
MPLYDVEHVTPLTPDQQATLAQAITDLHARRFKTPKTFINVRYTDVSDQVVFRGGKRVSYNRVVVRTRQGERRTKEIYDDHARDIIKAWEGVVVGPGPSPGDPSASLRTVWIMGALTTAVECGIARPKVGDEDKWVEENMDEFKKLAASGDTDFIDLLHELEANDD